MPRFHCPQPLRPGSIVDLPDAVAHHLHVVRQQSGDELVLFNGDGGQVRARLVEIGKRRASAEILALDAIDVELPFRVTLAQGLPEGSKMDWIVEKAVELGAAAIQPLAAQRSVVRLSGERADKRLAHLAGTGRLKVGESFFHESIIGSQFIGRVRQAVDLNGTPAIIPSIEGSAFATGFNTIWIDPAQPFPTGFQVK